MKIACLCNKHKTATSFGSVNCPVKSFQIQTTADELVVKEMTAADCEAQVETYKLAKFFTDNFIDGSVDPSWMRYKDPENSDCYKIQIKNMMHFIHHVFAKDDGNSTILVARDSENNVRGGIIGCGFDEFKGLEDPKTYYIDSFAVDKAFRKNKVGTILMNKSLETTKGLFTDAILAGYNKAVPMYSKFGFKLMDISNPEARAVFERVRKERGDIPKYTQLMELTLDENATRWWKRAFKNL